MTNPLPKACIESSESLFFKGSELMVLEGSEPHWEPLRGRVAQNEEALLLCLSEVINILLSLIQSDDALHADYQAERIRYVPAGHELYALARTA